MLTLHRVFTLLLAAAILCLIYAPILATSDHLITPVKLASLNVSTSVKHYAKGYNYCGNEEQVCPSSAPICCGSGSDFYCVPAGSTCCGTTRRATGCGTGEQCCSSSLFNSICCPKGTSCYVSRMGVPSCRSDECSLHATVDECLSNKNSSCGWCCERHRCVPQSNGRCPTTPITGNQHCPSRCHHADTCALCLDPKLAPRNKKALSYFSVDTQLSRQSERDFMDGDERCVWCCATMSCMPVKNLGLCDNEQFLADSGRCAACMHNGGGVQEGMDDMLALYSLLGSILFIIGVVCLFSCMNVFVEVLFEQRGEEPSMNGHDNIQRYGFKISDATPTNPLTRRLRRLLTEKGSTGNALTAFTKERGTASEDVVTCHRCNQPIRLAILKGRIVPTSLRLLPSDSHHTSQELPKFAKAALSENIAAGLDPCLTPSDDPAAILLPCNHCVCYACLGISKGSLKGHADPSPLANPLSDPSVSPTTISLAPQATEEGGPSGTHLQEVSAKVAGGTTSMQTQTNTSEVNNTPGLEVSQVPVCPPKQTAPVSEQSESTLEEAIAKCFSKGKCTACGQKISEYLLTSKVRLI